MGVPCVGLGDGLDVGVGGGGSMIEVSKVFGRRENSQRTTVKTPSSAVVRSNGECADCFFSSMMAVVRGKYFKTGN